MPNPDDFYSLLLLLSRYGEPAYLISSGTSLAAAWLRVADLTRLACRLVFEMFKRGGLPLLMLFVIFYLSEE